MASATACGSIACCTCRCTVSMRRMLRLIAPSGTPNSRSSVRSGPASFPGSAAMAAGPPASRRPAQPKPNPWVRNRAVAAGGSTAALVVSNWSTSTGGRSTTPVTRNVAYPATGWATGLSGSPG